MKKSSKKYILIPFVMLSLFVCNSCGNNITSDSVSTDSSNPSEPSEPSTTSPSLPSEIIEPCDVLDIYNGNFVFGVNETSFISTESNSLGFFIDLELKYATIEFTFKGEGSKSLYFKSSSYDYYRGRPSSSFYEFKMDEYGNLFLSRQVNLNYEYLTTSLALKDTYSSENEYTFTLHLGRDNLLITYQDENLIKYKDNLIAFDGLRVGFGLSKGGSIFSLRYANPEALVYLQNGFLTWEDYETRDGYKIEIDSQIETIPSSSKTFNLDNLDLEEKEHNVALFGINGEVECLLGELKFVKEGHAEGIKVCNGLFNSYLDKYISKSSFSLALVENKTFISGVLEMDIQPNSRNDCGMIFCVDSGGMNFFWEQSGCSYYAALINFEGQLLLGKVLNGVWTLLANSFITDFDEHNIYRLKVTVSDPVITATVNTTSITAMDMNLLSGVSYGFRSADSGVVMSMPLSK